MDRLHDISGLLLQHHVLREKFPTQLEEIASMAGPGRKVELTCPTTGKPYLYDAASVALAGVSKRIVVRDAEPHGGVRFAIEFTPAQGNQPLGTRVVGLVETVQK